MGPPLKQSGLYFIDPFRRIGQHLLGKRAVSFRRLRNQRRRELGSLLLVVLGQLSQLLVQSRRTGLFQRRIENLHFPVIAVSVVLGIVRSQRSIGQHLLSKHGNVRMIMILHNRGEHKQRKQTKQTNKPTFSKINSNKDVAMAFALSGSSTFAENTSVPTSSGSSSCSSRLSVAIIRRQSCKNAMLQQEKNQ